MFKDDAESANYDDLSSDDDSEWFMKEMSGFNSENGMAFGPNGPYEVGSNGMRPNEIIGNNGGAGMRPSAPGKHKPKKEKGSLRIINIINNGMPNDMGRPHGMKQPHNKKMMMMMKRFREMIVKKIKMLEKKIEKNATLTSALVMALKNANLSSYVNTSTNPPSVNFKGLFTLANLPAIYPFLAKYILVDESKRVQAMVENLANDVTNIVHNLVNNQNELYKMIGALYLSGHEKYVTGCAGSAQNVSLNALENDAKAARGLNMFIGHELMKKHRRRGGKKDSMGEQAQGFWTGYGSDAGGFSGFEPEGFGSEGFESWGFGSEDFDGIN